MDRVVMGIAGFSGSGKTTLIEKLIPIFKDKGYNIAVIKHDAHDFDMDREGKDTYRFTAAGADTVMISSGSGSAVLAKYPESLDEMIGDAIRRNADIVLVEGYKYEKIKKIFILSKRTGYDFPHDITDCTAIVTDDREKAEKIKEKIGEVSMPVFDIDDAPGIAELIINSTGSAGDKACSKEVLEVTNKGFSHFDNEGNARMVDVSYKEVTVRKAKAAARVIVNRDTFELIKNGAIKKGDVLNVAQIAGIMGSKRTPELIPMCHPVITDSSEVRLRLNEEECCIDIEAEIKCTGRTGVEMEAICACSTAAMTVYDMCKSVQRDIVITDIRLLSKSGGIHGDYIRDTDTEKKDGA